MRIRQKAADYFLDISKLVFAGVVLSTIIQIQGLPKLVVLATGLYTTILIALIGFVLMRGGKSWKH